MKRRIHNNKRKKEPAGLLAAVLTCFVLIILPLPARGDLLFAPEDSFYKRHSAECVRLEQSYLAEGPGGSLSVYKSPDNPIVVDQVPNGESLDVHYTYLDTQEREWAYVYASYGKLEGWTPLDYLCRDYDSRYFVEKHKEELIEQEGIIDLTQLEGKLLLWQYPGSERVEFALTEEELEPDVPLGYSLTYQDEYGRSWCCIPYYAGSRGNWICLDNMSEESFELLFPNGSKTQNEALELVEKGIEAARKAAEKEIRPEGAALTKDLLLVGFLVAAAVASTLILLSGKSEKHT